MERTCQLRQVLFLNLLKEIFCAAGFSRRKHCYLALIEEEHIAHFLSSQTLSSITYLGAQYIAPLHRINTGTCIELCT
jgi:hypothetical protein